MMAGHRFRRSFEVFSVRSQMLPPLAELPIRLPLLNFRALGSTAVVVYIQQW